MLFSRIISVFAFSMTLGGLALANPIVEKRDTAAVKQVVLNLKSSTDTILPQIENMATHKNATEAAVVPLMNQLIGAVNTAHDSLANVPRGLSSLEKRQNVSDIGTLLADIIEDVVTVLDDLLGSGANSTVLGGLLPNLDTALNTLLTGLGGVVSGLLAVVGDLLSGVGGLLSNLGLGLVVGSLGL